MIKIIKEGVRELRATCPFCQCEFTYEIEDLNDGMINCPCCGATLEAKAYTKEVIPEPIRDNMVWETPEYRKLQEAIKQQPSYVDCNKPTSPCETCSHYLRLKLGETYVGDSPCQWCQYGGLRVTCTSTGTSAVGVGYYE